MSKSKLKQELRKKLIEARKELPDNEKQLASKAIAKHALAMGCFNKPKRVAGYYPIKGEISVLPLLEMLAVREHKVGLPSVDEIEHRLVFREWDVEDELDVGSFGILQPLGHKPVISPDILLVPAVGYDTNGYRLGYGGGYYDKLIAEFKDWNQQIYTVGVAYRMQEMDIMPKEAHDEPLNAVITEAGVRTF
jgi:5-formyltetrahydrofolate cyclo-ligase